MTSKNDIYIHVVLDESGSMGGVIQETVDGFNEFVSEQKSQPGNAWLSLTKFSTFDKSIFHGIEISLVPPMTGGIKPNLFGQKNVSTGPNVFSPGGGTALNDAVVRAIRATEEDLLKLDSPPANVMVLVITDGGENSSRQYTTSQVRRLIEEKQEKIGWAFVFLGADQDAWANSQQYGFSNSNTVSYASADTRQTYGAVSTATSSLRSGAIASNEIGETTLSNLKNK